MKKLVLPLLAVFLASPAPAQEPQADTLQFAALTPDELVTADSLAALRLRLERKQIRSIFDTNDVAVVDTLP
ncbi:MAG: metalloendopeptidase, partial [Alistipes sp.]|nr:metalloendopeptidase [Alistipes sp.]